MGVLDGIRVLDLTRRLPGPFCTMLMADNGAEVIRIEQPVVGDHIRSLEPLYNGIGGLHLMVNRNKKSITLDLKKEKAKEIFKEMVRDADVIVEGFRPGVMERLGLSYKVISEIKPSIVYCSITGYGQYGPYRDYPGHDLNYIGYSGALGITGVKDSGPVAPGFQAADIGGGSLMALAGILMALYRKEKTGKGDYIDISMMDGMLSWLTYMSAYFFATNESPKRGYIRFTGGLACYAVYPTKDGKYLAVSASDEKFWVNLCKLIGKEEFIPKLNAPYEEQQKMKTELEELFRQKTRDEWLELLEKAETCAGPVNEMHEVFQDPQVIAREMVLEAEHPRAGRIKQLGFPIKFLNNPAKLKLPAPDLGENNEEILGRMGYSKDAIAQLKQEGII